MNIWNLIGSAGDAAVTLPLAALCAVWLACSQRRLAWLWLGILGAGLALVGLSKILYAGCDTEVTWLDLRMFSGHTTLATAIYTTLLALLSQALVRRTTPGAVIGLLIGVLIGVARVFQQAHSPSEAVAGWLLGCAISILFLRRLKHAHPALPHPVVAGLCAVVVIAVCYGHTAPFEALIRHFSAGLCSR